ncbi:MAG: BrnA antitoxin family protein [Rubrivivax sp.]
MSKTSPKRSFVLPTTEENRKIVAAARQDPDAQPLTAKQLKEMVPLKSLRGRPPLANKKQLVSVRYSPEVLDYFRGTGEGWQARMDGVLKDYVAKRRVRKRRSAA